MNQKELIGAYARVFGSEDGKAVLEDLKALASFDSYGISDDDRRLCYVQGRRSIVGHILNAINRRKDERRNADNANNTDS